MKNILLFSMILGIQSVWATTYTLKTTLTSPNQNFKADLDLDLEVEDHTFSNRGIINGSITLHHLDENGNVTDSEKKLTLTNLKTDDLQDENWIKTWGVCGGEIMIDLHANYISGTLYMNVYIEHTLYPDDIIHFSLKPVEKNESSSPKNNAWMGSPASKDKPNYSNYSNYSDAYFAPDTCKDK